MQPVLCLLKDQGSWRVNHLDGDFFSAVCRQAVKENGVALRAAEKRCIHLIAAEDLIALLRFGFFAHARPDIGVDHVSSEDGFQRIVRQMAAATCLCAALTCPFDRLRLRFVPRWRRDPDVYPELSASEHERMRNIVPIPHKRDLQAFQIALGFPDGEVIRHRLTGMAVIRESIDDRNAGVLRHLFGNFVSKSANHDALHHSFQVLGHVVDALAFAKVDLCGREINRKTAELLNPHIKTHSRAQRWLLENHRQRLALERVTVGRRVGLHLPAQNQQVLNLGRREILDGKKVFAVHIPAPANTGSCSRVNLMSSSVKPGLVSSSTS